MEVSQLIHSALEKAQNYKSFKSYIQDLFSQGKTTGDNQSEAYINYTELSLQRMKRWEKIGKINPELAEKIKSVEQEQTWLLITEAWCGDAAHALPFIEKLTQLNPKIELKIVLRDENNELMNQFLTHGGKSIPKLIAYAKKQNEVLFTWGPRPEEAMQLVKKEKELKGELDEVFRKKLQQWFNKDKGKKTVSDLVELTVKNDNK